MNHIKFDQLQVKMADLLGKYRTACKEYRRETGADWNPASRVLESRPDKYVRLIQTAYDASQELLTEWESDENRYNRDDYHDRLKIIAPGLAGMIDEMEEFLGEYGQ